MRALPWLQREFGWTNRDALNCMRVCELSLKSENFSDLDGRELMARETNVLIARLTEYREREASVRCSWPSCCHDRQQGPHLGRRMNSAGAAQQALGFESVAQRQEVHRGTRELASLTFHVLCLFQLGPASAAGLGAVEQGAADWTLHHGVNQVSR